MDEHRPAAGFSGQGTKNRQKRGLYGGPAYFLGRRAERFFRPRPIFLAKADRFAA